MVRFGSADEEYECNHSIMYLINQHLSEYEIYSFLSMFRVEYCLRSKNDTSVNKYRYRKHVLVFTITLSSGLTIVTALFKL